MVQKALDLNPTQLSSPQIILISSNPRFEDQKSPVTYLSPPQIILISSNPQFEDQISSTTC